MHKKTKAEASAPGSSGLGGFGGLVGGLGGTGGISGLLIAAATAAAFVGITEGNDRQEGNDEEDFFHDDFVGVVEVTGQKHEA